VLRLFRLSHNTSNDLLEHLAKRMPEEGRVFLQTESELAAINMVYGAAATVYAP